MTSEIKVSHAFMFKSIISPVGYIVFVPQYRKKVGGVICKNILFSVISLNSIQINGLIFF